MIYHPMETQERYETTKALFSCKMVEGESVSPHLLKMKCYIDHLERLGFPISKELATDVILSSLPGCYEHFVMDYNMNIMEESISELHEMLKTAKQSLEKRPSSVLSLRQEGV